MLAMGKVVPSESLVAKKVPVMTVMIKVMMMMHK